MNTSERSKSVSGCCLSLCLPTRKSSTVKTVTLDVNGFTRKNLSLRSQFISSGRVIYHYKEIYPRHRFTYSTFNSWEFHGVLPQYSL